MNAQLVTLPLLLAGCVFCSVVVGAAPSARAQDDLRVYLGTYTRGDSTSKGIYLSHLNLATGELSAPKLAGEVKNPSFLAIHPSGKFLYAVGELASFEGKKTGAVSALAIDPKTGLLALLNQQPSEGVGPCHVAVDHTGRCALVANYGSGSVASLSVGADGRLAPAASAIQHEGASVNPKRQTGPHAHSINVDPANRFAFSPDLGADKVFIYRLDPAAATLTANQPAAACVAPGSGPRHFAFHPNGRNAYVINELTSTITTFDYDAAAGALKAIQDVSTLPAGYTEPSFCAEVQVHPSGRFVYGSNRGHNSIAIFTVDAATGKLALVGCEPTQGDWPRNFGIDPSGRYLLAANERGHNVVVFRIDPESGKLHPTGSSIEISMPSCVKFLKP